MKGDILVIHCHAFVRRLKTLSKSLSCTLDDYSEVASGIAIHMSDAVSHVPLLLSGWI